MRPKPSTLVRRARGSTKRILMTIARRFSGRKADRSNATDPPEDGEVRCHRMFENRDILYLICEEVGARLENRDDWDAVNCRRTLAGLARVSWAFSDPALSMLWRDLTELHPILALRSFPLLRGGDPVSPQSSKWLRVPYYLSKVHILRLDTTSPDSSDDVCLLRFINEVYLGGGCPFPALDTLHWRACFSSPVDDVLDLIPRRLHSIHVTVFEDSGRPSFDSECADLISDIYSTTPFLRVFELSSQCLPAHMPPISSLTSLERLTLSVWGHAPKGTPILPSLSALQSLVHLNIHCWIPHRTELQSLTLSALRTLSITGVPSVAAIRAIQFIDAPNLYSLHVQAYWVHEDGVSTECFTMMHSIKTSYGNSLRTFTMEQIPPYPGSFGIGKQRLLEVIEPLLQLRDLTALQIQLPLWDLVFESADAQKIALAWPQIITLSIDHPMWDCDQNRPTVDNLVEFAQLCPDLCSLALPAISLCSDVSVDQVIEKVRTPSSLQHLVVHRSAWMSSTTDAARILDCLYPNLDVVTSMQRTWTSEWWCVLVELDKLRQCRIQSKDSLNVRSHEQ
ncbi:hypothetical protein CERSUDRAFT_117001 [Gelatoporia subvermispora B]|uniref:F-box domain-containing protein n=1 Tax=Ceriporiopsis subvermispora (strain B) TaxID=914234 RepID=M2QCS9_CERS8|nr:hypothetical protein CERSUDRAFT_117001 [Gelatoporia subvermispora B]